MTNPETSEYSSEAEYETGFEAWGGETEYESEVFSEAEVDGVSRRAARSHQRSRTGSILG